MTNPSLETTKNTAVVLANGVELIGHVIKEIAGNDIASSLGGTSVRMTKMVENLTLQRIQKNLLSK